jgi:hypothetical protein
MVGSPEAKTSRGSAGWNDFSIMAGIGNRCETFSETTTRRGGTCAARSSQNCCSPARLCDLFDPETAQVDQPHSARRRCPTET